MSSLIDQIEKPNIASQRRQKKKGNETFNIYIYKVLKQIYPEMGITVISMKIMNSLIYDIFTRIAQEASHLVKIGGGNTLDTRCIETATKLVLINGLRKHGLMEARKAVNKYNASIIKCDNDNYNDNDNDNDYDDPFSMKNARRSTKAGLVFPVGRIAKYLKEGGYNIKRIASLAPIYMAAILEYFIAEIIELSGNTAKQMKRKRILPMHIYISIKKDDELKSLLHETIMPHSPSMESIKWFCKDNITKNN